MNDGENVIDNKTYRILIVDDEGDVLNALRSALEEDKQLKCKISTANNGEAGLNEIEKREFDLVLSDYKMPGMSGVELLTKVKNKHPNTIRMLITGYSDTVIAKEAINKANVYNYIEKPCDREELRSVVYEALKRKTERESGDLTTVDNVKEALKLLDSAIVSVEDSLRKQKLTFALDSAADFNRFSLIVRDLKNVYIDDFHIFEDVYVLSVTIHPKTVQYIK